MEKQSHSPVSARNILTAFMEGRAMRKTPERYEVLRVVETMEGIFTIEDLMKAMSEKAEFQVSRATLFNTMELLCDAGLLIKHPLATAAHYERRTDNAPKAYVICRQCNSIAHVSLSSARLALQHTHVRYFNIEDMLIYMHGICRKCQTKRRLAKGVAGTKRKAEAAKNTKSKKQCLKPKEKQDKTN